MKSGGFTGGSVVKNPSAKAGDVGSIPELARSPGRKWQPGPVFLPGKCYGQRSLVGYSPRGCKESDVTTSTMDKGWSDLEQWRQSTTLRHGELFYWRTTLE